MPSDTAEATEYKELRRLACKLTQAEFNEKATEFAELDQQLEQLEADKKLAAEGFKNRIGGIEEERSVLRQVVITRHEERSVECTWYADFAGRSMILRRDDTGEAVEARTMTATEAQTKLEYTPKSSKARDTDPLDA